MAIHVHAITNQADFFKLRDDWCELLARSSRNSLFLTWEWISTWLRYFHDGTDLFVLTVRDSADGLIGLAPLRIMRQRQIPTFEFRALEFLGTGSPVWSDDVDFLEKPGREQDVCAAIGAYLLSRRRDWDIARLTDIAEDSQTIGFLSSFFRSAGLQWTVKEEAACPCLSLDQPWEVYDERAHRKFRDLKKYLLALQKSGAEFGLVTTPEMLERTLDALLALNQQRTQSKDDISSLSVPNFFAFVKDFARTAFQMGQLRFYYIMVEREFVAVNLNFVYDRRVYGYLSGLDPAWQRYGVGTCLFWHVIRDSWGGGLKVYDFLRGDEAYKYRWTTEQRKTVSLNVINHPAKYSLFHIANNMKRGLSKVWRKRSPLFLPS